MPQPGLSDGALTGEASPDKLLCPKDIDGQNARAEPGGGSEQRPFSAPQGGSDPFSGSHLRLYSASLTASFREAAIRHFVARSTGVGIHNAHLVDAGNSHAWLRRDRDRTSSAALGSASPEKHDTQPLFRGAHHDAGAPVHFQEGSATQHEGQLHACTHGNVQGTDVQKGAGGAQTRHLTTTGEPAGPIDVDILRRRSARIATSLDYCSGEMWHLSRSASQ